MLPKCNDTAVQWEMILQFNPAWFLSSDFVWIKQGPGSQRQNSSQDINLTISIALCIFQQKKSILFINLRHTDEGKNALNNFSKLLLIHLDKLQDCNRISIFKNQHYILSKILRIKYFLSLRIFYLMQRGGICTHTHIDIGRERERC